MVLFLVLVLVVAATILVLRWLSGHRENGGREARLLIVPDQYESVGGAIRAASSGDTVLVRPGVYRENVDFLGKEITVVSENPDDQETVGHTVIDGDRQGPAVFFGRQETRRTVLKGFTITGGIGCLAVRWNVLGEVARAGGGVFIGDGSNPTVRNNVISGNAADMGGGLYVCATSAALIEDNEISSNCAVLGGGMRVARDFPRPEDAQSHRELPYGTTVRNCRFIANRASIGGGVSISRGVSPELSDNVFSRNTARWDGGAIAIWDNSSPRVLNSEFSDNTAGSDYGFGAGVSIMNDSRPQIRGNRFVGNQAVGKMKSGGGALAIYRSTPTLVRNTARDNRAKLGCNMYLWGGASAEMQGNDIEEGTVFIRPSEIAPPRGPGPR